MITATHTDFTSLPASGISKDEVAIIFEQLRSSDKDGRSSFSERWMNDRGLLLDDGALEVVKAAHLAFFTKNSSSTPIMKLERELVSWVLDLFRAEPGASGSLTSGGSESLFLATAAALAGFQDARAGGEHEEPYEVVIPQTGYPTFEKYSRYLGYTVRRVPVDDAFRANPKEMEGAITDRTFMILGSMSSWSHGACDPIPALAKIAEAKNIWLHVDACVGGMLAPFARDLGRDVVNFDFSNPGVSSISVDFHKYGYSSKGVSGLFFRNNELSRNQPFVFDGWAAGLYRCPTVTGTRSGGAIASAWAVARYLGREGYQRRAAQIFKARDTIVEAVRTNPDTVLLGGADLATVAIGSNTIDISAVSAHLKSMGWSIGDLQAPDGFQLVLGPIIDSYIEAFVDDLSRAVETVKVDRTNHQRGDIVYSDEIVSGPGSLLGEA